MLNIRGSGMRNMCRVCLSGDGALADLFTDSRRLGRPIVEALRACAPIQITKNDGLPAFICKLCYLKLDLFTQFQISALESDEILRRYRRQLQQKNISFVSQVSSQNVDINIVKDINNGSEGSHSNGETTINREVSKHNLGTPKGSNNDERIKLQEVPNRYDNEGTTSEKLLKNTTVDSDCDKIQMKVNFENVTPQECIVSSYPNSAVMNSGTDTVKDRVVISKGLTKETNNSLLLSIKEKMKTIVGANEVASNNCNLKQKSCVLKENGAATSKNILNGSMYSLNSVHNKIDVSEASLETNYNLRLKRKESDETVTHIPNKEIKLNTNKLTVNVNKVLQTKESSSKTVESRNVNKVLQTKESSSKTIESRNHFTGVPNELAVVENLLECNVCKRIFDCTSALNIHKLFHTDRNNYIAPKVSKVVERSKNIIEEPYRCDVCSKRFKEMAILTQHKLLHNQINMVNTSNDRINTSNKAIAAKQNDSCSATEHFQNGKQVPERCFGCDICNKRFFTSTSLDIHKRIHQKRTYECSICSKQFTEEYRLKEHKRKHKKRYRCNICKRKFAFIKNFNNHQKTHSS